MWFIGLVVSGVGLYSLVMKGGHLLLILLSLECISLGVFLGMAGGFYGDMIYIPLVFLIFVVSEGVLGLAVLIMMSRVYSGGALGSMLWGYINYDKNMVSFSDLNPIWMGVC
uniref:NADH dehydrogenase subunit 4L n=1 Tax=Megalothorax incertus TaxID=2579793 RepID=A0A8E8L8P1_9HEXA|nr:NADH dehydrogenase subunit 4L [Megalothorax incertus]